MKLDCATFLSSKRTAFAQASVGGKMYHMVVQDKTVEPVTATTKEEWLVEVYRVTADRGAQNRATHAHRVVELSSLKERDALFKKLGVLTDDGWEPEDDKA